MDISHNWDTLVIKGHLNSNVYQEVPLNYD